MASFHIKLHISARNPRAAERARDAVDVLEQAHLRHDLCDLVDVADVQPEEDGRSLVAAVWRCIDRVNVHLHLGGHCEEFREHTVAVVAYNLNADDIVLVEPDVPTHIN